MGWKLLSCYLEWNVIQYNFNHKKIETRNIFDHGRFREEVDQLLHKKSLLLSFLFPLYHKKKVRSIFPFR